MADKVKEAPEVRPIAPEMEYACPHTATQEELEMACIGELVSDSAVALPICAKLGITRESFTTGMARIAFDAVTGLAPDHRQVTIMEIVYSWKWTKAEREWETVEATALGYLASCVDRAASVFLASRDFSVLRMEEARRIIWSASREALEGLQTKRDTWEIARGLGDALRALASIRKAVEP